jgi:hypothetical protein
VAPYARAMTVGSGALVEGLKMKKLAVCLLLAVSVAACKEQDKGPWVERMYLARSSELSKVKQGLDQSIIEELQDSKHDCQADPASDECLMAKATIRMKQIAVCAIAVEESMLLDASVNKFRGKNEPRNVATVCQGMP